MKLESVKLKNFRGYRTETIIPISDLTAFIGKNEAGKSTILEALEIFFNNNLVSCEKADLNIDADNTNIEITCVFSAFPDEIIIDTDNPTTLQNEYLLNPENRLEIKKVFSATTAKPKEKIFIVCNHPSIENGNDLLILKRAELRQRADSLQISQNNYNSNVNSSMRGAIWNSLGELNLQETELLVDEEDTKKVYEALKNYLPIYALFQSDRQSKDDDKEVTDPMKIAVQQALSELTAEIEHIKTEVKNKALETANRTLAKLKEMSPELANELIPEFKTEPKFDSLFKLTINSDDGIPLNKRGSGIRRLILLSFFRAEAERIRAQHQESQVIFAFEEPENSQHPDHQVMLINTFMELANTGNSQIILTTHTPALASLLPLESLRFIEKDGNDRIVELGTDQIFEKIADTLGILADPISKNARAILLLEGKSDVTFVNHTATQLKKGGHIEHTFEDKRIALVPIGGCDNLKHWRTLRLAEQFEIPYCVMLDSDKGTNEEQKKSDQIQELQQSGIKAYVTRKRELENYIHLDCLNLPAGSTFSYTETCDAKCLIANEKSTKKTLILETYWRRMTSEQIREVEMYDDNGADKYEFTEMFTDFLNLVNE
ncbi:AAA family ATPase [Candidatus Poribacteria bacterium]|nr:AAA family ATPase [Candidatus Poribacteria bacterium]